MRYRPSVGETAPEAVVRVVGTGLAVVCAMLHGGAAVYWFGVSHHFTAALVSLMLAAVSIVAVVGCLVVRSAVIAAVTGAGLAVVTVIVTLLYGV